MNWKSEFASRFRRHEEELKWLYCELYHNDLKAYGYFVEMLYRLWEDRPEKLKMMDRAREESESEAKAAADEIIKTAKKQAVTEKEKILKDAQKEITGLVEAATRKIMLKSDTDKIYEEFLTDAERSVKDGKESV